MIRRTISFERGQWEAVQIMAQAEERTAAAIVRRAVNKELIGYGDDLEHK